MQAIVWNGFTAFGGTLDRTMMQLTMTDSIWDLEADVMKFYRWLEVLRRVGLPDANNCGIPQSKQKIVRDLLTLFFPAMTLGNPPRRATPLRVSDTPDSLGGVSAQPIKVTFGPQNATLDIVDGAGALGYIFSIVEPPQVNPQAPVQPQWDTYFLPMLLLYSKCLFLAYITPPPPTQGVPPPVQPSDVPFMSAVMYDPGMIPVSYFFGSTYTTETAAVGNAQVVRESRQRMLDLWRREQILGTALPNIPVSPPAALPPIEPRAIRYLGQQFYLDCVGKRTRPALTPTQVSQKLFDHVNKSFNSERKQANLPICAPQASELVYATQSLKSRLLVLADQLVALRIAPDFNPANPAFLDAFLAFFQFFLVPHMFPPKHVPKPDDPLTPDVKQAEIVTIPPPTQKLIDEEMQLFWITCGHDALERLTDFLQDVPQLRRDNQWVQYGRCAETYPFGVVQPYYFPGMQLNRVRGYAMEVRCIGNSPKFQNTFDTDSVNASGLKATESPYRYPCANCTSLIPVWQMQARQAAPPIYDANPQATFDADLIRTPKTLSPG